MPSRSSARIASGCGGYKGCRRLAPACQARTASLGASSIQTLSVRLSRMTSSGTSSSATPAAIDAHSGSLRAASEADRHHRDVAQRIDDAVAGIADARGRLAVAVDDHRRVLEDLPRASTSKATRKRRSTGPFARDQPQARRRTGSRGRCGSGCTSRRASGWSWGRPRCYPQFDRPAGADQAGGPSPAGSRRRR